ncbi:MAG: hypothetical protein JWM80_881 [Cyanobacteria bacterium RYN_339]|nr:hypothetical protein [Cyanobacteria bacterium RYN_339]
MRRPLGTILSLALLLCSCKGQPAATRPKTPTASAPLVAASSAQPASPGVQATPAIVASPGLLPSLAPASPAASVAPVGGGLVTNNGGNIVSDHGGGIVGVVRAPAGLAARRLLALQEQAVGGVTVALQSADGKPVLDASGKEVTSTTKPDGSYALVFGGNAHNLVVAATLPGGKGNAVAFVPKGVGDKPVTVDLDSASTYALGYILQQYVRVQPEPVAVLDKLPAEVAQDTRAKTAVALGSAAVPDGFSPEKVVAAVESLRRLAPAVNQQMDYVRSLLFAGLSNQGIGRSVTDVELDPLGLALSAAGELYYSQSIYGRIFKKSQDGHLLVVAGNGEIFALGDDAVPDGTPALQAAITPTHLAFDKAGNLFVLDGSHSVVRRIAPDGTIATYAKFKAGTVPAAMCLGPDGTVWVALRRGVYRVDAKGATPTLVAGEDLQSVNVTPAGTASGDGGPPLAARFKYIQSITVDPASGEAVVFDSGAIRRIGAAQVSTLAGSGDPGHRDGQGAAAQFSPLADIAYGQDGVIYVADSQQNYLRTVTREGVVATLAGNGNYGPVSDGPAVQNVGVPFAPLPQPDGTLYFVSEGMVRALAKGQITTIAGSNQITTQARKADAVQFEGPKFLRYDAKADAMVVTDIRHLWRWDLASDTFRVLSGAGIVGVDFAEGGSAAAAALLSYSGPNLNEDGSIEYIVKSPKDVQLHVIRQVGDVANSVFTGTSSGPDELSFTNAGGGAPVYAPALLTIDGLRYYTVAVPGHIRRIEADGSTTPFAGYGTGTANGTLAMDCTLPLPNVLERGPDGQLYVGAYSGAFRIDLATNQITRLAGLSNPTLAATVTSGMKALDAPLLLVSGIIWDAQGRMLFSDVYRGQVMRRELDGSLKLIAGKGAPNWNGKGVDEGLGAPTGLAFDKRGNLFILDLSGAQIKRVPASGLP